MSASGSGIKKQKLNNSSSLVCNGTSGMHNGTHHIRNPAIVQPEMAFYCFDVLYSQLHQIDPPISPKFSNEAL